MGRKPKSLKNEDTSHKKTPLTTVRRSGRLQTAAAVVATENHYIEQIIEDITVVENDDDDEFLNPTMVMDNEPIDYIMELQLLQTKAMNDLKSQRIIAKSLSGESSGGGVGEGKYKCLYFDSQKKLEALIEENNQLKEKLEMISGIIQKPPEKLATEEGMLKTEKGKRKRGLH